MAGAARGMFYGRRQVTGDATDPVESGYSVGPGGQFEGITAAAIQAAHDALPSSGGIIQLSPATYTLEANVTITKPNVWIRGSRGAKLVPTGSGSIGAFQFSAEDCRLSGIKVSVESAVNDQRMISAGSGANNFVCEDVLIDCVTAAGSGSNPMHGIDIRNTFGARIRGCDIYPAKGFRPSYTLLNSDIRMSDVQIRTPSATFGGTQRGCYEAIRWEGNRYQRLTSVSVLGLGTLTTDECNEVVVIKGDVTKTVSGGDYAGLKIKDLTIAKCASPKLLSLYGVVGFQMTEVHLEDPLGAIAAAGEAALFITSEDDTSTVGDESKICGVGEINDIVFENAATGAGVCGYFKDGKKIGVANVQVHAPTNGPTNMFMVNIDRVRILTVGKNILNGDETNTMMGWEFECAAAPQAKGLYLRGPWEHSSLLVAPYPPREPAILWAGGAGSIYEDGSEFYGHNLGNGTIPFAARPRPLIDSSGLGVTVAGNVVNVPTVTTLVGTASGSANYATKIVANKLNRLLCGFGYSQPLLAHNGGTPAGDGSVAAVVTAANFNTEIQEIEKKINEFIDMPKSAAGVRKFHATRMNGVGGAGAVAAFTNLTGGTAVATGVLVAISDATTANNVLATFISLIEAMGGYLAISNQSGHPSGGNA